MLKWLKILFWIFFIILLTANLLVWIFNKTYVYKAIYHNFATIYDHRIFKNNIIETDSYIPVPVSSEFGKYDISDSLKSFLLKYRTTGLLIIRQDSIIYENYWNDGHKDSVSNSFSMAKTITGLLTGIAIDKGFINSIDDLSGLYYSPYLKNGRENISIRHLLSMSSGLEWKESYYLPISVTTEAYYGNDLAALIDRLRVRESPGKIFRYQSSDTQILGMIITHASDMSLSDFASEFLWKPLGAEKNALWSIDKKGGYEKAYCCYFATLRDFARIGLLLLNNGKFSDQQIVSGDFINNMTQAHFLPDDKAELTNYYGWQTWILPDYKEFGAYYARGIYGQFIIVVPALEIVVVRLGHWRGNKINHHWEDVYRIMDEMISENWIID